LNCEPIGRSKNWIALKLRIDASKTLNVLASVRKSDPALLPLPQPLPQPLRAMWN
jgi:hypothetical protein